MLHLHHMCGAHTTSPVSAHGRRRLGKLRHLGSVRLTCMWSHRLSVDKRAESYCDECVPSPRSESVIQRSVAVLNYIFP